MAGQTASARAGLLEYLPAIYHEDPFLGQYLSAFEQILLGSAGQKDGGEPGLEQKIENIAAYFDPLRTPPEFLQWLSGWVALSLRADLDEFRQREFIKNAVRLYRLRGTKKGLEEIVSVYTRLGASITETAAPFQVETPQHSRVGVDTMLEGGAPFVFRVTINLSTTDPAVLKKQRDVVTVILRMEKPAHTQFVLEVESPTMQIGDHSQVEVDTLLGEPPTD
jgi:phage tail-like protein